MIFPDFSYEEPLWSKGFSVIGIDEVGRGAFAGPVCVGGVVFSSNLDSKTKKYLLGLGINDSKKLTSNKRESLASSIKENASAFEVSFIDVNTINEIGIGKATFLAMLDVVQKLLKKVENPHLLIDAYEIPGLKIPQQGIIRGDSLSLSIASASILAKVARDQLMSQLGIKNPEYQWAKNKGYGTLDHRRAIAKHGQTQLHRTDFCRKIGPHLLF